jgi:predicted enzyme related to lactoylglutathione lyase
MIKAVHALIYSRQPETVRAFLRDTLGWDNVDSGGGWLIFALPPAELGVHPTNGEPGAELYLMCDDIDATVAELTAQGVEFTEPVTETRFGRLTRLRVADGETLPLYQPHHASPLAPFRSDGGFTTDAGVSAG